MTPENRARLRADLERGQFPWRTEVYALLDTADERDRLAVRVAELEAAARFPRNALIEDEGKFRGRWVAVPREDFEALRALLAEPAAEPRP